MQLATCGDGREDARRLNDSPMSPAPHPGHSSRTFPYALLPLAVLVMRIHCVRKDVRQSLYYSRRGSGRSVAHLVAVPARTVNLRGDGHDLVAVLIHLSARTEADVEPGALQVSL